MAHPHTTDTPARFAASRVAGGAGCPHWIAAHLRALIFAAAGLSLTLTGCTDHVTGRGAAGPDLGHWQAPLIQPQQLDNLLLGVADVNTIGHATAMTLRAPTSKMERTESVLSDPQCLGPYTSIQAQVYRGSNWTAVRGQMIDDVQSPDTRNRQVLVQAVVGFRDADSARQFFTQAKPTWSACANRPITVDRPGHPPVTYDFGALNSTETTLSMVQTRHGGDLACQRALGLVNNVIVETEWCGFNTTDQADQVITKITAAATQA